MIRLSPQDLDRIENERLDREQKTFSSSAGLSAPLPSQGRRFAAPEVPPLRNSSHGWQPTLDDVERR